MALALAGQGIPTLGRVRLEDLVAVDGLPSDLYKNAVTVLSQSLARFNAVVIQLAHGDDVLLRCVLGSVKMFFHQRPLPGVENVRQEEPQDWTRTAGYFSEPQHMREFYDYRPGRTSAEASSGTELPPSGLPELFAILGRASRSVLDAIGCSLELRSFSFTDLLDNIPLRHGEVSTSMLSACCLGRPGVLTSSHGHHSGQEGHMQMIDDHEPQADKGLLTLMKSDKPGFYVRDVQGRWILADADLGPSEMVLYTGLSLYQATAGFLTPAIHRTEIGGHEHMFGRCYVAFKLMPRASAILHCGAMTAAGHNVATPYSTPVAVHEFMQRTHSLEQLMNRTALSNFTFAPLPPPASSDSMSLFSVQCWLLICLYGWHVQDRPVRPKLDFEPLLAIAYNMFCCRYGRRQFEGSSFKEKEAGVPWKTSGSFKAATTGGTESAKRKSARNCRE